MKWIPHLWENKDVRTTVEIPDALFREAKAEAARNGILLDEFLVQAVRTKLGGSRADTATHQPWRKAFGGLRHLQEEHRRIETIIAQEFGRVDEREWS